MTRIALVLLTQFLLSLSANAQSGTAVPGWGLPGSASPDRWLFQTSVFTKHFSPDPRHDNSQRLLNLEYWRSDSYLAGLALFDNSFGQRSTYGYVGKIWRPWDSTPATYVKLTGGLLYGYKGEFKNKIPFNQKEIAPVIIPSIGYHWGRLNGELVLFGAAGIMVNLGFFF